MNTFRGLCKGLWVYGVPVILPEGTWIVNSVTIDSELAKKDVVVPLLTHYQVDPDTIGQQWEPSKGFTCFTGDLVEMTSYPSCKTRYKRRLCKIMSDGRGLTVGVWHKDNWWVPGSINWTDAVVVGNIWENVDFIK